MMGDAKVKLWVGLLVLVAVAGLWLRLQPELHRPLEHDEISSALSYTSWSGKEHAEDFGAAGRFRAGETAKGLALAFAYWKGPNNHMAQNLMASVGSFFFGFGEGSLRAPAVVCSIVAALLLMAWAYRQTGSPWLAALGGALLLTHPYLLRYGMTARGYAASVCLLLLQVLWVDAVRRRERYGAVAFAGVVLVGYGMFLNLVSLLLMWLAPLALVLFLGAGADREGRWWSRSRAFWFWHGAVLAALMGQFMAIRLPTVLFSQDKFGVKFSGMSGAIEALGSLWGYLFPGPVWGVLGAVGVIGLGLMAIPRRGHWLGPACGLSVLVTLAYVFGLKKMPYERTFGYLMVAALLGVVWLWKAAGDGRLGQRVRWGVGALLVAALGWNAVNFGKFRFHTEETAAAAVVGGVLRKEDPSGARTLVLLPDVVGSEARIYLPKPAAFYRPEAHEGEVAVVWMGRREETGMSFRCRTMDRAGQEYRYWKLPAAWVGERLYEVDDQVAMRWRCEVRRLERAPRAAADLPEAGILFVGVKEPCFDLDKYVAEFRKGSGEFKDAYFVNQPYEAPKGLTLFFSNPAEAETAARIVAALEGRARVEVRLATAR